MNKGIFLILFLNIAVACSTLETPPPIAPTCESAPTCEPAPSSAPEPTLPVSDSANDAVSTPPIQSFSIIYDDDGSPDGTTALLYLLSHPRVDVRAVNLTYGEVYPEIYIQHLGRMMDDFGIIHIPLGFGEIPENPNSIHFPEFLREASSNFWGFPIPNADKSFQAHPSPELIVSVIRQAPKPVVLFVTGPCTNLAEALRIDQSIRENIASVFIMGGAVYVRGNIHDFYPEHENTVAEWNFVADPQAAKEVLESGLDLYLVPLDATNQVLVNNQDTRQWHQGGEIAQFAADIYDWLIDVFGFGEAAIWDLMTAAIMLEPDLCDFTLLHLDVITENGPTLGQSVVVSDGEHYVYVCLRPNADEIRQNLIDVFSKSR